MIKRSTSKKYIVGFLTKGTYIVLVWKIHIIIFNKNSKIMVTALLTYYLLIVNIQTLEVCVDL